MNGGTEMKDRPLWSDLNPEPETLMIYEGFSEETLYNMIFNLYEDIRCLKEDLEEK